MTTSRFGTPDGFASVGERDAVEQVVRRGAVRAHAEPGGRVRLRVEIDEQHALARLGEAGADVDGGRRLPDAALLVRDCVDPGGHARRLAAAAGRLRPGRAHA